MIETNLIKFFLSLIGLWFCSEILIRKVTKFSHLLKISGFALSFFFLGFLTSLPETLVGVNSILQSVPEVFIGNMIGSSLTMFVFIIPLMAILSKGVNLSHDLSSGKMATVLFIISLPAFFVLDKKLTKIDAILMILAYAVVFYLIEKKRGILDHLKTFVYFKKAYLRSEDILIILISSGGMFLSSRWLVQSSLALGKSLEISPFIISLVVLSIGVNLPELVVALDTIFQRKKDIALGNYFGSACSHTLFFGILTFFCRQNELQSLTDSPVLILFLISLLLFFLFAQSKNRLSRGEGLILLSFFAFFLLLELKVL